MIGMTKLTKSHAKARHKHPIAIVRAMKDITLDKLTSWNYMLSSVTKGDKGNSVLACIY